MIEFAKIIRRFAADFEQEFLDECDFEQIDWRGSELVGWGSLGFTQFNVTIQPDGAHSLTSDCTACGKKALCDHAKDFIVQVTASGVMNEIARLNYVACSFTPRQKKKAQTDWKKQLSTLEGTLRYHSWQTPQAATFPRGRKAIYVVTTDSYYASQDYLEIAVATEPLDENRPKQAGNGIAFAKTRPNHYRMFTVGVRGLAASPDEIDREVAEKLELAGYEGAQGRQQIKLKLLPSAAVGLLNRLSQAGKLYCQRGSHFSDDTVERVRWISDEMFDLRFELRGRDAKTTSLGLCAVNSGKAIHHDQFSFVAPWYFVDKEGYIGLFRRRIPRELPTMLLDSGEIVVPRGQAKSMLSKLMGIAAGMGVEFYECDDIKPRQITTTPKPRIHISAPFRGAETLSGKVFFDYDGVLAQYGKQNAQLYDEKSATIVTINEDFHRQSIDQLLSAGAKTQKYSDASFDLRTKALPTIVSALIRDGWHVEADGKLYRTGSRFDLNIVSGIDWFELQGKAHFEQTTIDLPQILHALRAGQNSVVLDDGTIGLIPEQWLKQFSNISKLATEDNGSIKFGKTQVGLLDAMLIEQGEINVDEKFRSARESIRGFDQIQPQNAPAGFVGTLRPYQQIALGWFEFLRNLGFGGCLADDMGLGKTIQVLAMLENRRETSSGPSLIVVPRSLIFNWISEATKFAPGLRILDQSHSQRRKRTDHLSNFDLVLTTYGTLCRDAAFLKDFEFDYVILDEAQAIKNAGTETAKAARLLKGRHKLALSGTPIENHLGELWSLFDFLNPGMLGRIGRFNNLADKAEADDRALLAAAVRPFILRRTKKQVAPELPDRIEQTIIVELETEQRKKYDELRDYYRQSLLTKIEADGIGKSQIVILEALLRLRQAACHPGLIDKTHIDDPSAKLEELLSRLSSAVETGERVLVFSQFTSLLAIVKQRLKKAGIEFLYLDGKTKNRQELVDQFQSGNSPGVFLISLKAGGVGLNLTSARTVYLLDPWWNPAVEAQAIDRTHRIGQQQTVFAIRLIAADTVEQKVLELQSKKKGLADAIINQDNACVSSLTREDIEMLLA